MPKTTINHVTEEDFQALADKVSQLETSAMASESNLQQQVRLLEASISDLARIASGAANAADKNRQDIEINEGNVEVAFEEIEQLKARLDALVSPPTPDPDPQPEPQPDPLPPPQPVEFIYTREGIRAQFKYPTPGSLPSLRAFNPPPISQASFSEDWEMATACANAVASNSVDEVLAAFSELRVSTERDPRKWWDNDLHGRSEFPFETVLHLKLATLGHQPSVQWISEMLAGDEMKYSPYKLHNTLCALGPFTGGVQHTGKHYTDGFGQGYEGMFTNVPFFLLYCWYWMTGEDLISSIPMFKHIGRTIEHRYKDYHQGGRQYARSGFTLKNIWYDADPDRDEGLTGWPTLPFGPFPSEPVPRDRWWWNAGDHVASYYGDGLDVDISIPATDSSRSSFHPRCFAAMRGGKGLPWTPNFKGGCSPRATSGIMLADYVSEMTDGDDEAIYYTYDTAYKVRERANNPIEQSEHLCKAPTIVGDEIHLEYPRLHNRKGHLASEVPYNAYSRFDRVSDRELNVVDEVEFTNPNAVTLTFTLTSIPAVTQPSPGRLLLQCDGFTVEITGGAIATTKVNTVSTGARDTPDIDELYNPYNLEIVKAQVFVEFAPSTLHTLNTNITFV